MDKLVSVIVPVYNGEDYIGICLDSIRKQSYAKLEIIVVNDGSQDRTREICSRYVQQEERMRLVTIKNSGVSAARNAGMRVTRGEYIGFVDSDDYLEPEFIESLLANAIRYQAPISMCNYNFVVNGRKHPVSITADKKQGSLNKKDFYTGLMEDTYRGFLWNKLFERQFLMNDSGVLQLLNCDLKIGEDLLYVVKVARQGQTFYFDKRCLYNYVQRDESAYNTRFHPGKLSEIKAYDAIMEIISAEIPDCVPLYQQAYLNMALKLKDSYCQLRNQWNEEIAGRIEQVVSRYYAEVMKSSISRKRKIFYAAYRRSPRLIRGIKKIHHKVVYH